jgi:hypothetical protein
MRDIREDLMERLFRVKGRYCEEMVQFQQRVDELHREHKRVINECERERLALEQMIAIEDSRTSPDLISRPRTLVPLIDFLIATIDAYGPIDKDELRNAASQAGYFSENNGRTFHTTLLNLTKHGRVAHLADGTFVAPDKIGFQLFGMDKSDEAERQRMM